MKLAIVSDLHIGYERFEEDSYRQAREALEKASEVADAILIAGDVFDKRAPKPEVIAQAINIFRDISEKDWKASIIEFDSKRGGKMHTTVPIIAIPGTHERVAEGKENVLSLLALAGLLVDVSEARAVIELGKEKVSVFGLGGVSEERVLECIKNLDPKPVFGAFNVFMMHQSVYELLPFSEQFMKYGDLPKGFDLYINGHLHNRVEATVHGKKFLIPGSTVLTQLKDGETDRKGFVLFDTATYTHSFIEINSRAFISRHITFEGAGVKEILQRTENEVDGVLAKNKDTPIIRLVIDGTLAKGIGTADVPLGSLASKYAGRAFVYVDSDLVSPELQKEISDIRENKLEGTSIRELGARTFSAKLKEHEFDSKVAEPTRLFEILSGTAPKEKVIKEASDFLDQKGA